MENKEYKEPINKSSFDASPFDEPLTNASDEPLTNASMETASNDSGTYHTEAYQSKKNSQKAEKEFDDAVATVKDTDALLAQKMIRNRSLIEKLFPGKMDRLINSKERLLLGSALDYRLGLLKMANQFRTSALKERYETALHLYQTINRLKKAKFQMDALNQLMTSARLNEEKGLKELENMYRLASAQKVPQLKSKYLAKISDREDAYLNYQAKLMEDFERVIYEGINV